MFWKIKNSIAAFSAPKQKYLETRLRKMRVQIHLKGAVRKVSREKMLNKFIIRAGMRVSKRANVFVHIWILYLAQLVSLQHGEDMWNYIREQNRTKNKIHLYK